MSFLWGAREVTAIVVKGGFLRHQYFKKIAEKYKLAKSVFINHAAFVKNDYTLL